jgi:hypothetical protein
MPEMFTGGNFKSTAVRYTSVVPSHMDFEFYDDYECESNQNDESSGEEEPIPRFSSKPYADLVTETRNTAPLLDFENEQVNSFGGDDWWYDEGGEEEQRQSPSRSKKVDTYDRRPLTASVMNAMLTPAPLAVEQRIKRDQVVFSPIVTRSRRGNKAARFWQPSKYNKFVKMYNKDKPLFSSRTRWAGTKLSEIIVATREDDSETPNRLRTIVAADLLNLLKIDIQPFIPNLDDDLNQDLLSCLFPGINPVGSSGGCRSISCGVCSERAHSFLCPSCKKRFCDSCFRLLRLCDDCVVPIVETTCAIRASLHPFSHMYPPGSKQLLDEFKINHFMSFQTWFEYDNELLKSYRYELDFDPQKREMDKKMAEERRKNIAVLNRSTKRWQVSITGVIFRRWRDVLTKVKAAQQRMIKLFHKLKGASLREIFKAWKTSLRRGCIKPMHKKTLSMNERMEEVKNMLKHVGNRVEVLKQRKIMAMGSMTQIAIDVQKEEDYLQEKWRNPKILQFILHSMLGPYRKVLPGMRRQSSTCANELTRRGSGTYRISSFVQDRAILKKLSAWDSPEELESDTPHADEDIAYPFHTRVAKLLIAWELHCIAGGEVNALAHDSMSNNLPIGGYEDLLGGTRYLKLLNEISEYHHFPESFNAESTLNLGRTLTLDMEDRCKLIVETGAALSPPVTLLQIEELFPEDDEEEHEGRKSPSKTLGKSLPSSSGRKSPAKSKKKKRPKIRRKMTTMYMGQKVELEDDTEQRHFAFLSQLFLLHKGFPAGSPLPGDDKWRGGALDDLIDYFINLSEATKLIFSRSKEKINFANNIGDLASAIRTVTQYEASLVEPFIDLCQRFKTCSYDRDQMYKYSERLLYLVWASIYLTVLGRRTTIEEDVDDGSFTALDQAQISDVFKKLPSIETGSRGLTSREQEDTMTRLHEFLVFHLRNSRQIFDHYSAAAHGGEKGTMDRSEYWRLVKDVGMHKQMSSAEIDLLFQKANIDYAKTGTNRVADMDAELQPIEFIEVLIRLSYEKYKQKDLVIRLELLYKNDLLPNAQAANKNAFQEMLRNPRLKRVMQTNKRRLRSLFKIYAAGGDSSLSSSGGGFSSEMNSVSTISPSELVKLCRDLKLVGVGKTLSDTIIRRIFAHVQQDDDGQGGDEDDNEMVFEEFTDIVVALTCFTDADPYFPLEKKVEKFCGKLWEEAKAIGLRL